MIHQLLTLTRPLFVVDTETTGTQDARIVEIGFQQWEAEGLIKEWRSLVNPGIPIPPAVTKIHGISDETLKLCKKCGQFADRHPFDNQGTIISGQIEGPCLEFHPVPTFAQLAPHLARGFQACDYAGKNVKFDLRMLAAEFARVGVEWSYAAARIVDADRLEQLGEPRSLSDLYRKHVGEPGGAHQALADVRMTADLIAAQLRKYGKLPRDLDALHELQWPGVLDADGKFRIVNGVAICCFGKWRGRPMKDIEPGYWDWIIKNDFPADVKALASAAKLRKFPGEKE